MVQGVVLLGLLWTVWVVAVRGADNGVPLRREEATATAVAAPTKACTAVDVVFTWVNGSAPAHRAQLAAHGYAWDGGYRDYGTLRYALRSVERHMPWARHVVLVTNGETPAWLNASAPRLRVVPHAAFFADPAADLPTFNSNAIEANLHRIPGLAPCLLYLNDDMFLGADVRPDTFFDARGRPRVDVSPALVAPAVVLRLAAAEPVSAILLPPGQSAERPPCALSRGVFVSFAQPQRHTVYGYRDRSVRVFTGDKLQNVWYPRCTAVTCAASSGDGACLVFGGADSTVRVFTPDTNSGNSKRAATLETVLCGHTTPVSCIAVSRNHSLVVSGATDGTLVFWDLNRHVLVHEVLVAWRSTVARLRHRASPAETPVIATDIHIITGNVAACTRRRITLWSVNAELLAAVTLSEQGAHLPAAALTNAPVAPDISCCLFSQEWIPGTGQVLLTGHVDGSIRVWDVDSVEGAPVPPACCAFSSDGCVCSTEPPDETVLPVITLKHILYTGENSAVTALYVPFTDKTRLFAGTAGGVVVQIADVIATKKR